MLVLPAALLAATGTALVPLEQRIRTVAGATGPAVAQLRELAGRGGTLAVLGGWRSAVASGFWLRADLAWESRDAAGTIVAIGLTVAADERPLGFWLNGSRMIANDLPEWLPDDAPAAMRQRVREEHARRALEFLARGLHWHGPDAALHIEMANIHLRRRGDLEAAARCYRLAAETPGAPYYAARIHAEMLRALGRPEEALQWLRQVLPSLPVGDPAAARDVVGARIAELEREVDDRHGGAIPP